MFDLFELSGKERIILVTLLGCIFLINITAGWRNSLTYDERDHYRYGEQVLALNSDRFDDSKMPFSALNALLGELGGYFPSDGDSLPGEYRAARIATILFSIFLALIVFSWARNLFGIIPAFFAVFLYAFEPNLLAHSELVTTDLYAAGTFTLALYSLWRFARKRTWSNGLLFGLALGIAQLAKYSAILLYPLAAVMILTHDAPKLIEQIRNDSWDDLRSYLRRMSLFAVCVVLLSLLVINAGFLFNRSFTPLRNYQFRSEIFQHNQLRLRGLGFLPVPVPYPYLEGLDYVLHRERTGEGYGNMYLLGEIRKEAGFQGYYLIAFLYKTPLALQILFITAIISFFGRFRRARGALKWLREDAQFLLIPILIYAVYFNFFYNAQIGIRFLLIIYPAIILFIGSILEDWREFRPWQWAGVGILSVYLIVSTLSYYPHFIPYFNELLSDRRLAYQILADSNLDWGQNSLYVKDWLGEHPDASVDPPAPVEGLIAISPNNLVGITAPADKYAWLRESYLPIDTIGYSYLVYDVASASGAQTDSQIPERSTGRPFQPTLAAPTSAAPAASAGGVGVSTPVSGEKPQVDAREGVTRGASGTLAPCSPLQEHDRDRLPEILSAAYSPPVSVAEERHHGVDFSYYRQGARESILGEGVQSVYPGFVAASVSDRFPYGNMIIVETPLDWLPDIQREQLGREAVGSIYHLYAHLNAPAELLPGERIEACQIIGAVGKSGNAGVAHLHLEMRTGPSGVRFESMAYYSTAATDAERQAYERWRTGGEFIHINPMALLNP